MCGCKWPPWGVEKRVISGFPKFSVLGPLLFILYTQDIWISLENQLVAYAADATLIAVNPHHIKGNWSLNH